MVDYDLCVAWNWEYDADFIRLLLEACSSYTLSVLQVEPPSLEVILHLLISQQMRFTTFIDRASDEDHRFFPLVEWASAFAKHYVNPHQKAVCAWDKAAMHYRLIAAGIHTPYTIILPPYTIQPDIAPVDLVPLGTQFTIKPSHGGGSQGVRMGASSFSQVVTARKEYPADTYLLQATIIPRNLAGHKAWFRVLYCYQGTYLCWWDPTSHHYAVVTNEELKKFHLGALDQITRTIATICELDLFSTEIALTSEGVFVVVDYANDQIDLRLQSKCVDGVPDIVIRAIANQLARQAALFRECPTGS